MKFKMVKPKAVDFINLGPIFLKEIEPKIVKIPRKGKIIKDVNIYILLEKRILTS